MTEMDDSSSGDGGGGRSCVTDCKGRHSRPIRCRLIRVTYVSHIGYVRCFGDIMLSEAYSIANNNNNNNNNTKLLHWTFCINNINFIRAMLAVYEQMSSSIVTFESYSSVLRALRIRVKSCSLQSLGELLSKSCKHRQSQAVGNVVSAATRSAAQPPTGPIVHSRHQRRWT